MDEMVHKGELKNWACSKCWDDGRVLTKDKQVCVKAAMVI